MTDLTRLTIAQARTKLRAKDISAAELTESYLSAIEPPIRISTPMSR